MADPLAPRQLNPLERVLKLFADVRPGEGLLAVVMMVNILLLMFSYYIIKTAREPLILTSDGGAELKSYASGYMAITLIIVLPAYNWLTSKVDTRRLLFSITGFFLLCIQGFFFALQAELSIGVPFFIWVGIFSLSTIALFWSFANEVYTREAGERLFPIIGIGMTGGAFGGSFLAKELFGDEVAPGIVLQVAAALLLAHGALYVVVLLFPQVKKALGGEEDALVPTPYRGEEPGEEPRGHKTEPEREKKSGLRASLEGFELLVRKPYIGFIAALILLLNVVNTTGEYILASYVVELADAELAAGTITDKGAFIGAFYGDFFLWVNVAGVALQAFVASRLVKYFGIAGVLFALPFVAGTTYLLAAMGVGFVVFRWSKSAENATDYSVMNTARAMLWLPTTREEKYTAKQTIDTLIVRLGDLLSAGLVFAGTEWLDLSTRGFAWTNLGLVGAWFGLAWLLLRSYKHLAAQKELEAPAAA